ncbi:MAG: hypothetical protein A2751_02830 [Candidatus Doudnabacteria bacterium RIFCSPHIGHO2_01_FULL_46_14]|uniref:Uncharacterized protein n=1 Tax=Candidatus Doudnabacteria bacterium RIFCSPHIGHO2_01_FULL_46_14 TaxID=1817824 RepID=A0A1F5NK78_9BACT|nr:MAG: hypothetical protein A2751_02830 [Candidatus Doudnabacteria bacterium RIFCSPHIGHO2_01_FULL_46_14]
MQVSEKLLNKLNAQFGQIVSGITKTFISVIKKKPEQYEGPSLENASDQDFCLVVYLSQDPPQGGGSAEIPQIQGLCLSSACAGRIC